MTVANRSRALVARLACALAMAASAPEVFALWPASGGGPLNDSAFATVTDQSGNIYVAGEFRGVANFRGTDYSAEGLSDLFVAKYSPDGALIYVRTAGGPSVRRVTGSMSLWNPEHGAGSKTGPAARTRDHQPRSVSA